MAAPRIFKSEAASEKKKRGRPRLISDQWRPNLAMIWGDRITTERGLQDVMYRCDAHSVLKGDARFTWLIDPEGIKTSAPGSFKQSILSELGRLRDAETIKAVALQVCELKPRTKAAIVMIRQCRTGKGHKGTLEGVYHAVAEALCAYLEAHPETSETMIETALKHAIKSIYSRKAARGST